MDNKLFLYDENVLTKEVAQIIADNEVEHFDEESGVYKFYNGDILIRKKLGLSDVNTNHHVEDNHFPKIVYTANGCFKQTDNYIVEYYWDRYKQDAEAIEEAYNKYLKRCGSEKLKKRLSDDEEVSVETYAKYVKDLRVVRRPLYEQFEYQPKVDLDKLPTKEMFYAFEHNSKKKMLELLNRYDKHVHTVTNYYVIVKMPCVVLNGVNNEI